MKMKAIICIFSAVMLFLTSATYSAKPGSRDPRQYFFTLSFGNLPEEMRIAREEGKQGMLLFFEADDCVYCQRMLSQVFNQRAVQDWYGERFISIAVDVFGDIELTDFDGKIVPSKVFSDQQKVFGTPVVSFLDLNGIEIYRHFGMIGTPQEFLLLGEYIADKHYEDTEFEDFLSSKGRTVGGEVLVTPSHFGKME